MGTNRELGFRAVTETTAPPADLSLSPRVLAQQNRAFAGTGGVSKGNAGGGFFPAFKDQASGTVYLSCFSDGTAAPLHVLDGLPEELVAERSTDGCVTAVKPGVVAGFIRDGLFYTREQAARAVAHSVVTWTERSE